ncbi:hypothetical protein ACPOL_3401 [Acidisarcina polymorpha]|uniref:Uncharacterized protein n=1 Tax=Acidisarcina polymorpha TaxID=2211140 RepID=A0A2Z5G0M7_9BACT|nr:hypothetical protein ACPOL_3401 [Acidisarcina polymorpha]
MPEHFGEVGLICEAAAQCNVCQSDVRSDKCHCCGEGQ